MVSPIRQTELHAGIPHAQLIEVTADHAACVTGANRFVPALLRALRHVHTESGATARR